MAVDLTVDEMSADLAVEVMSADVAVDVMSVDSAVDWMFGESADDEMSMDSAVDWMSGESADDEMSVDSGDDVLPRDLDNGGKGINVAHFSGVVIGGAVYIEKCCPTIKPGNLILGGIVTPVVGIVAPSSGSVIPGVENIVPAAGVVSSGEEFISETVADTDVVMGGAVYIDTCCPTMKLEILNSVGIVDPVLEIVAPSSGSVIPGVEIIVPVAGVVSPE
ncbi:hypothetical protein TNCV_190571 [Trichonephila clavipes]|nr:hypothetical protein TNCV_190571 [Trichonephila clavipes]